MYERRKQASGEVGSGQDCGKVAARPARKEAAHSDAFGGVQDESGREAGGAAPGATAASCRRAAR